MGIDYIFEAVKVEGNKLIGHEIVTYLDSENFDYNYSGKYGKVEEISFDCRYGYVISFFQQLQEAKIKISKNTNDLFIHPHKRKFLQEHFKGKWVEGNWILDPKKVLNKINVLSSIVKENDDKLPKFKEYNIGVGTVEVSFYNQYKQMFVDMKEVVKIALKNDYTIRISIG